MRQTSLDKLLAILFVHEDPKILGHEVRVEIEAVRVEKKMLKRYTDLLRNIRYAWQKVRRYEDYFDNFYPPNEKISEIECLTHHVHAYLDDLYTVRTRIFALLDALKNDSKKVAGNAKEFKKSLDDLKAKMLRGFEQLDKCRGDHRHVGTRFYHEELLRAENAETQIMQLDQPFFNTMFDEEKKKKIIERLTVERSQSFAQAKTYWIETAKRNGKNIDRNTEKLFEVLAQSIYQLLNIEESAQALQLLSKKMQERK